MTDIGAAEVEIDKPNGLGGAHTALLLHHRHPVHIHRHHYLRHLHPIQIVNQSRTTLTESVRSNERNALKVSVTHAHRVR